MTWPLAVSSAEADPCAEVDWNEVGIDNMESESEKAWFEAAKPNASISALEGLRCDPGVLYRCPRNALTGLNPSSEGSTGESVPTPIDEPELDVVKVLFVAVPPTTGGVIVNSGIVVEWFWIVSAKASEESEEEYDGASGESISLLEFPGSLGEVKYGFVDIR